MQEITVITIIAAAVLFIGVTVYRKRRAFSTKSDCGSGDCGCGK